MHVYVGREFESSSLSSCVYNVQNKQVGQMAQCYTLCQKWPSHAIGWPRQGTNNIEVAKWCVCVCVSERSLIRHEDSQVKGQQEVLALTLSQVKKYKKPTLLCMECKSNQDPSFPC